MPGTYSISGEALTAHLGKPTPAHKFCALVSFNGGPAHYHEVESLDPATIDAELQKTADDLLAVSNKVAADEAAKADVVIEGGKIKL